MIVLNKYKVPKDTPGVYIGRGSPLGNEFAIGDLHDGKFGNRKDCIELGKEWLLANILFRNPKIIKALKKLNREDNLLCYCSPEPCHGDYIVRVIDEIYSFSDDFDTGLDAFCFANAKYLSDILNHSDGVNYINVSQTATSTIGKTLYLFAKGDYNHTLYGKFKSIEGFVLWLNTGKKHDKLRDASAYDVSILIKNKSKNIDVDDFIEDLKSVFKTKVKSNEGISHTLKINTLPIHSYLIKEIYGNNVALQLHSNDWIVEVLREVTEECQT